MDGKAIVENDQSLPKSVKDVPYPFMERLILGTILGGFGGVVAGAIAFPDMLGAIVGFLLAPFFGIIGGSCGVISKRYGWATVRPIVWAILGGIVLHVDSPLGWIIGGGLGSVINGMASHALGRTARKILIGASIGIIGWAIAIAYITGCGYFLGLFLEG